MKPPDRIPEDDRELAEQTFLMARDNHRAIQGTLPDGSDGVTARLIRVEKQSDRGVAMAREARWTARLGLVTIGSVIAFLGDWILRRGA